MVRANYKGYDHLGGTFVFCPNCGTQNDSAATPCKKCGFKLSGISVPKFKGTMMLNSDQTVAEMIEEHRKKQVQGGAAEKTKARASEPAPRRNPGSSAPPSSLGGPRGPVLQPPRAAAPTRGRMGGTMLGVAPQVGGHAPPGGGSAPPAGGAPAAGSAPAAPAATPPSTPTPEASPNEVAALADAAPTGSEPEPFAGTLQVPEHPSEPEPPPAAEPRPVARTRPLAAVEPSGEAAAAEPSPAPNEPATAETPEPTPPPARAVAVTAPLPAVVPDEPATDGDAPATPLAQTQPPAPSRLTGLDIVLIICTCGLYGLVLWAKQRKPSARA